MGLGLASSISIHSNKSLHWWNLRIMLPLTEKSGYVLTSLGYWLLYCLATISNNIKLFRQVNHDLPSFYVCGRTLHIVNASAYQLAPNLWPEICKLKNYINLDNLSYFLVLYWSLCNYLPTCLEKNINQLEGLNISIDISQLV